MNNVLFQVGIKQFELISLIISKITLPWSLNLLCVYECGCFFLFFPSLSLSRLLALFRLSLFRKMYLSRHFRIAIYNEISFVFTILQFIIVFMPAFVCYGFFPLGLSLLLPHFICSRVISTNIKH